MSMHMSDWLNIVKAVFTAAAPAVADANPVGSLAVGIMGTIISQLEKNAHTANIINRIQTDPNLQDKINRVEALIAEVESYLKANPTSVQPAKPVT